MRFDINRRSIRIWGVPAISALATILLAATMDPDQNWARLRSLPGEQRQKLVENLKKFDLLYNQDKQQALRDLDRRLNELEPTRRTQYLAVLRGYHNWLNQLPEKRQDELNDKPPGERMALVKKLVADYPVPKLTTPHLLQITDVGDYTPFELAALFKIWQTVPAKRRDQIERLPAVPKRHEALFKEGEGKEIPRELKPADFEDKHWVAKFEEAHAKRPLLLLNQLKKKEEALRAEILRRQAINFYFLKHQPRAVTEERLADFLAAFPGWLQSTFDQYSPDEARRRLTIVYRLVFPFPAELKASQRPAAGPPAARGAPGPAGKTESAPGRSPF
jgi:hypothetical protein